MKKLLFMFAALAFVTAPLLAQEVETLPDGRKVKITQKDGVTIIEEVNESEEVEEAKDAAERARKKIKEVEDELDRDLPEEIRDILERLRGIEDEDRKTDDEWEEEVEEDGVRIRIHGWDGDMPEEFKKAMEEMRKRMEEMRKDHEEHFKKIREEMEKNAEEWESDPDAEVEEYESEDGSVKIKIVRIRKVAKSGDSPEIPEEEPKKKSERKQ